MSMDTQRSSYELTIGALFTMDSFNVFVLPHHDAEEKDRL